MRVLVILTILVLQRLLDGSLTADDASSSAATTDRNAIALEALSRLKGLDIESNPGLKAVVLRVLESFKGSPQLVEIVRDFQIAGQEQALLEFALEKSTDNAGVEAGRLLLTTEKGLELLRQSLISRHPATPVKAAELLGNIGDERAIAMLGPLVIDDSRDLNVRKQAVHALAQSQEGASVLLALAREGKIPAPLKLAASAKLNTAPWPAVKQEASEVLPLPQVRDNEPLPPISQLARWTGNAQRGAEVFSRPTVGCASCHRAGSIGVDFGPNLSEIGTKLGKDALYESVLDPSAGVSFGFEGWEVILNNGDGIFGLLASETAHEIAIKTQNGIVSRYKKSDVAKRQKLATSIMPTGLQQAMSTQDLVDLIEYLASLKAR